MNAGRSTLIGLLALLWAVPLCAQPPAGVIEYYHVDALGSVRAVTNSSGVTMRTHHYRPFGEGVGVDATTDPMRFTGKPRDGETGLDYFGARYYAPKTGRFTTVDPLISGDIALLDPQRWNRYSYVGNRPLRLVDPDGRGWLSAAFKLAKAVVKGGDFAATFSGVIADAQTTVNENESGATRVWAGVSLASELAPISIGDAKTAARFLRLLPAAPPRITQKALDHIVDRHWHSTGHRNVSTFADWIGGRELVGLIQDAATKGSLRTEGGRTVAEHTFDRIIGRTMSGAATNRLRVVIDSKTNRVITAYPF